MYYATAAPPHKNLSRITFQFKDYITSSLEHEKKIIDRNFILNFR